MGLNQVGLNQKVTAFGILTSGLLAPLAVSLASTKAAAPPLPAATAPPKVPAVDEGFFTSQVRPILEKRCLGCHGVGSLLGGLDLRSREGALKGGTRGAGFVAGHAEKSSLFQMVLGTRTPRMPPSEKLPNKEIAVLKRWLDGGAPWAGGKVETAAAQVWWSFVPPVRPAVPAFPGNAWVKTPIDAFVLAKLQREGLRPNPPTARRVLIRRAYLDMLGIPPTPEDVRAFEQDRAPDAWEKVVDRLLASPHYGERWGRHWLDLVRFAESCGYEGDKDRPLAYRYRDYVIRSFNEDKRYDQFIKEQLAGDELNPDDPDDPDRPDRMVATYYLGTGMEDFAMAKLPTTRADELDDLVSTTSSVFMGLTIGCARCHDHKYDPVKQTDYYRLQALFAPSDRREADIGTPEDRRRVAEQNAAVDRELAPVRQELQPIRDAAAAAAKAAGVPNPSDDQINAHVPEAQKKQYQELRGKLAAGEGRKERLQRAIVVTDLERTWKPVHLLLRGDANHPGPIVQPGFVTGLPNGAREVTAEQATPRTTGRRKALAEWIAQPSHPLTARVWMNRVWRQHFGRGLVASTSNFGVNGDQPSHPELLDWLAVTFAQGHAQATASLTPAPWQLKPIHRLILLSSAYQQGSAARADALAKDPQNRFLWRMPVRRLEAEAIRDSMLAVTGALNREMYGPSVYPPVDPSLRADTFQGINWPEGEDSPKTWRRSVYVKVKRSLILPQLEVFDCPEITASVAQRNVTTTPLQALLLLNDPLIRKQAKLFAERLRKDAGEDPARQVARAYWLALCREPTPRERELGLAFLHRTGPNGPDGPDGPVGPRPHALTDFCQAVLNLNEFVYAP